MITGEKSLRRFLQTDIQVMREFVKLTRFAIFDFSWQHSRLKLSHMKKSVSLECRQDLLRNEEVENRNAVMDPSFHFSRSVRHHEFIIYLAEKTKDYGN